MQLRVRAKDMSIHGLFQGKGLQFHIMFRCDGRNVLRPTRAWLVNGRRETELDPKLLPKGKSYELKIEDVSEVFSRGNDWHGYSSHLDLPDYVEGYLERAKTKAVSRLVDAVHNGEGSGR